MAECILVRLPADPKLGNCAFVQVAAQVALCLISARAR